MTKPAHEIIRRTPSVEEYLRLRDIAGLSPFSAAAAAQGLKGTVFSVVVEAEGKAIGMGRLIGDGGCFFQVVDIAVDPEHQGRGLGKAIVAALMQHVTAALPASAYVSLIADVPANRLYEKFGFAETAPRSLGMAYRVK
ncbi:GNAT family N-acetyltransferase [Cereibacter changlensis]|uniref:GNAT family N-acetyltransferase n=1 Tax=Cereibacter changlensis TaxID=402884 RepID=A0A4U0Z6X5_9RHOB|nr:GNAT family N-acetyltransferase [Cereibacter changlensis]TKA97293.1 GNAT family N-acetyltransferase [Cereibacter changlensis]